MWVYVCSAPKNRNMSSREARLALIHHQKWNRGFESRSVHMKYNKNHKHVRGMNRWNNGATRYGNKYFIRVLLGQIKIYKYGQVPNVDDEGTSAKRI